MVPVRLFHLAGADRRAVRTARQEGRRQRRRQDLGAAAPTGRRLSPRECTALTLTFLRLQRQRRRQRRRPEGGTADATGKRARGEEEMGAGAAAVAG